MLGILRIEKEYTDGTIDMILSDESNYILNRTKAYLLSHIYYGDKSVDPITSFKIGMGGAAPSSPGSPLQSSLTETTGTMLRELKCLNESSNTPLYYRNRITHNNVLTTTLTSSSPKSVTYTFYIDYDEANGLDINEVGLITRSGRLFNHKTFPTVTKDSSFKLRFTWTVEYL